MEDPRNDTPAQENIPKFRGLYRHVKISVKALDCIIVACIAVILIVFAYEMINPGYTVTFDSKGGTDVAAQQYDYGDKLELPEPPLEAYTASILAMVAGPAMPSAVRPFLFWKALIAATVFSPALPVISPE